MASQRMIPSMVVDMFLQNGIHEVKLYSPSLNVLRAFAGTQIGVSISFPNEMLIKFVGIEDVRDIMHERIVPALQENVKIRYLCVGSQPFSKINFNKTAYFIIDMLELFQKVVKEEPFVNYNIKVTMSHFTDVLIDTKFPSKGEFDPSIKSYMARSTKLLQQENAPIWLDMFLIKSVKNLFDNDIEFAFIDNNSSSVFMDGDKKYNNMFEVLYDTFLTALSKIGISNVTIIVGQIGWPTDGIDGASIENAHRFFKGFLKYIVTDKGTPMYPHAIDAFIYNLADESKLRTTLGNFIRHWGIYKFDGFPKYNIDFTGQDRELELTTLKGITHMPKRWCIFNGQTKNMTLIKEQFDIACNVSDCTSMAPGGSCSHLGFPYNISYAFNMHFQTKSQRFSEDACNFEGLGAIVPTDPSTDHCIFPVQILSSEYAKDNGTASGDGTSYSHLVRPIVGSKVSFFILLLMTLVLG